MEGHHEYQRGETVRVLQFPQGYFHQNLIGTVEQELSPPLEKPLISVWVARKDLENWAELMDVFETFKRVNEAPEEYGALRIFVEVGWIELVDEMGNLDNQ